MRRLSKEYGDQEEHDEEQQDAAEEIRGVLGSRSDNSKNTGIRILLSKVGSRGHKRGVLNKIVTIPTEHLADGPHKALTTHLPLTWKERQWTRTV